MARSGSPVLLAVGGGVLVAALSLVAFTTLWPTFDESAERVRPNVSLGDVPIGGASRDDARVAIRDRLARYADSTITLEYAGGSARYRASELGYRPEVEATLAKVEALGVPLKREEMLAEWSAEKTPREIQPAFSVDLAKLGSVIDGIARQVERDPVDAALKVNPDTSIALVPGRNGVRVPRDEAMRRLQAAFGKLETSVVLPVESAPPVITDEDTLAARRAAEQFVGGELEVHAGTLSWTLSRGDLASWIAFEKSGDGASPKLRFVLHPERPRNWLVDRNNELYRPARNARLRVQGGQVSVLQPDEPGAKLDELRSLVVLLSSGAGGTQRSVELPVETLAPRVSAADAARLRFPDLLADSSTVYGGSIPERNHNVELAASRLDGLVIPAGGEFSFNRAVGRTRVKDGYKLAFGIVGTPDGAQTVPSVAGGICQVATTLFHSAFWAGLPIAERNHHLYWIPKYGVPPRGMTGLDATVDEDSGLDFRFVNSTEHPILVQSTTDGNRVMFRLHGTKPGWEVTSSGPSLTNFVRADHTFVRQEEPSVAAGRAIQVEEARDGFDSLVTRSVKAGGKEIDRLEVRSHYVPARNVMLIGTRR